MKAGEKFFLPYQARWANDPARLRICEKSRQIGLSYVDSFDSVCKAAVKNGRDVWVMSRDEIQAKEYVRYCTRWAKVFRHAAQDFGEIVMEDAQGKSFKVQVLEFASGARIYGLSSNPDAIVGKTGHVKIDEYCVHPRQREVYRYSKAVTQWGGTFSIISTHRGVGTVFNELIRDIREKGNPMGWSLHSVTIQQAVADGIVEKINAATGEHETRAGFLARTQAECMDEEQWMQEYCCIPADDAAAFISYEMISACESDDALRDFDYLNTCRGSLYVGVDVGRKKDLTVIDIEEKVGDVLWERMRIELEKKTFAEQEFDLHRILALSQVKRCCIDSTGLGMQFAERAKDRFGWKVEAVQFTAQVKEDLAYPLRAAHEDRTLRYARDARLRADLRGIRKETTSSNNIRFVGESEDSHCDRFWAKALAVHAAKAPAIVPMAHCVEA